MGCFMGLLFFQVPIRVQRIPKIEIFTLKWWESFVFCFQWKNWNLLEDVIVFDFFVPKVLIFENNNSEIMFIT